ncbi:hypothetical protein BOTBODRAFT_40457 [Botryobasidium botryosum FD-172 SS1]|uniref:WD40 repeat-like protein n=1 Tax=Botryobasidium botryosum (strain FD-172 SS1) TaxID=930990 RepID=A0A067NDF1_BOTB1|nr:hypothetical protein BOTBODRAFT_40457 [Botryobasidium botryosum FD-172 SS1]
MSFLAAVSTSSALKVIDPSSMDITSIESDSYYTALAWSPDNTFLFAATPSGIDKISTEGVFKDIVFRQSEGDSPIRSVLAMDKGNTVVFSRGTEVCFWDVHASKMTDVFTSHTSPIISLTLNNDETLLASTTVTATHVHNLTHKSHTMLKHHPSGTTSSLFHFHRRTILCLVSPRAFVVYDTTRPSAPMKTVTISSGMSQVACSPWSKNLFATSGSCGLLSLIDLDKEKSVIKTRELKVPVSSLAFQQVGTAVLAGTENGKILQIELRAAEKAPISYALDKSGARITCVTVMRKPRGSKSTNASAPAASSSVVASNKPLASKPEPSVPTSKSSSHRPKSHLTAVVAEEEARRVSRSGKSRAASASKESDVRQKATAQGSDENSARPSVHRAFSPISKTPPAIVDQDADVSVQIENLRKMHILPAPAEGTSQTEARERRSSREPKSTRTSPLVTPAAPIDPPLSATSSTTPPRADLPAATPPTATTSKDAQFPSTSQFNSRTIPDSGTLPSASSSNSRLSEQSRMTSPDLPSLDVSPLFPSRRLGSTSGGSSTVAAILKAKREERRRMSGASTSSATSLRASKLPDVKEQEDKEDAAGEGVVASAVPARVKGLSVFGLSTPEVDRWIAAGKGPDSEERARKAARGGKRVGWTDEAKEDGSSASSGTPSKGKKRYEEMSTALQLSPAKRQPLGPVSPYKQPSSAANSAPDLLRAVVRDVMYEFQQETREELIGLHLDLVKAGRGWKNELRKLMDEYVGEMRVLREENENLRKANERLRRGY